MADSRTVDTTDIWKCCASDWLVGEDWVACLSDEERVRCEAPVTLRDRKLLTASAVLKRAVLARYLGIAAKDIHFELGIYGKPRVVGVQNPYDYRFNLSHSGSVALLAVTRGREVGVDVERVRNVQWSLVADQMFSPAEQATVRDASPAERTEIFFRHWTAREAYLKAIGCGLASPRQTTTLGFQEDRIWVRQCDSQGLVAWRGLLFSAGDGHQAALVVEDRLRADQAPLAVKLLDWGPSAARSPIEAAV